MKCEKELPSPRILLCGLAEERQLGTEMERVCVCVCVHPLERGSGCLPEALQTPFFPVAYGAQSQSFLP